MNLVNFIVDCLMVKLLKHKKNILVLCEEENNHYKVICRRKTKTGFKTIIINHEKLLKLFNE